ncbi:SelT/SelW/SelH family protein [Aspergillus undulatus]|uniref:SelT/SelW/SelH family protein n=1 Tax=Aspergillus undulatus TaxID=1810928 RepID=UPI003CCE4F21
MTEPTPPIETNPPQQSAPHAEPQSATCTADADAPNPNPKSYSYTYQKPRITIEYCTQCKWMLRAAYFAQELLSTFNTDIGEIALIPRTGGVFTVTLFATPATPSTSAQSQPSTALEVNVNVPDGDAGTATATPPDPVVLWDRKRDGGFPEVKELKSRVRNVIDSNRDLGHTDRALKAKGGSGESASTSKSTAPVKAEAESGAGAGTGSGTKECEDCK